MKKSFFRNTDSQSFSVSTLVVKTAALNCRSNFFSQTFADPLRRLDNTLSSTVGILLILTCNMRLLFYVLEEDTKQKQRTRTSFSIPRPSIKHMDDLVFFGTQCISNSFLFCFLPEPGVADNSVDNLFVYATAAIFPSHIKYAVKIQWIT